ncbi:MAG TPA: hypothetical protein VGJ43_14315, partial [Acidimicrobiales bacterium]
MTLVARTRRLDADVDLFDVAGDDGCVFEKGRAGVAGRGCALRIEWPGGDAPAAALAVAAALGAVGADDAVGVPGTGAVAFGALPFVPGGAASFVVPELIVGRAEDGTRWVTTVSDDADPAPVDLLAPRTAPTQPRTYTVAAGRPPEDWCDLVGRATKAMVGGAFAKVVLARLVEVTADRPLDRRAVLDRLRASYPGCHLVGVGGFVA